MLSRNLVNKFSHIGNLIRVEGDEFQSLINMFLHKKKMVNHIVFI